MTEIHIDREVVGKGKSVAKREEKVRFIHVLATSIALGIEMLATEIQLIRGLITAELGRGHDRSIEILEAVEIEIATETDVLSVVKCGRPKYHILGIFMPNLGT